MSKEDDIVDDDENDDDDATKEKKVIASIPGVYLYRHKSYEKKDLSIDWNKRLGFLKRLRRNQQPKHQTLLTSI